MTPRISIHRSNTSVETQMYIFICYQSDKPGRSSHGYLFKVYISPEPSTPKDKLLYGQQDRFYIFSNPAPPPLFENIYLKILSK